MLVTFILACGAIAHEIEAVRRLNAWERSSAGEDAARATPGPQEAPVPTLRLQCLPADWHNRPEKIAPAVLTQVRQVLTQHADIAQVLIAYGDCGSGGDLDRVLSQLQSEFPEVDIARLPGAHCYAFFVGLAQFQAEHEAELGTFYVTDFLLRHFDRLIVRGLQLDRHPELLPLLFGNYTRLLWLHQTPIDALRLQQAQNAAARLQLRLETRYTGYGVLQTELETRIPRNHRAVPIHPVS